jgi:hypothetical protein
MSPIAKKTLTSEAPDSLYPYISQIKNPRWQPFFLSPLPSEIHLPEKSLVTKILDEYYSHFVKPRQLNLEELFWFVSTKRIVDPEFLVQNAEIFEFVLDCEVENHEFLGFTDHPIRNHGKVDPKAKNPLPNLFATFYGLAILDLIGRKAEYLERRTTSESQTKILALNLDLTKNGNIRHCANNSCSVCKQESGEKCLFFALGIYDLMGSPPTAFQPRFKKILENVQEIPRNVFRLLCLRYMGIKDIVQDEEIVKIFKFQKQNGGFTFEKSAIPNPNDTFWIGMMLDGYRWLLPYPPGPIFAYSIQYLKSLAMEMPLKTGSIIISVGQIFGLVQQIWETVVDELENLIFSQISDKKITELSTLSRQGGVAGAEQEIIDYINTRYHFKLEIKDNITRFRQYVNSRLDQFQAGFARDILAKVETYAQFELSDITREYNRGKRKQNRISDDFLIQLINDMIKEYFFQGRIVKKSRGLFTSAYFLMRDSYIDFVIVTDRPISKDDINREKRRLKEITSDIYNMTLEMKNATDNIMNEIESLILAEELTLAEDRMRVNIKKALFDASFFKKNIESFQEEFVFLKADLLLQPQIRDWNQVYNALQDKFTNTKRVLTEKIAEIRLEKEQHQRVLELEQLVQKKTNQISDRLEHYLEGIRNSTEDNEYNRKFTEELELNLQQIGKILTEADHEIKQQTDLIKTDNANILKIRKKTIDAWISQITEFEKSIAYYQEGLDLWRQKINQIDIIHQNFIQEVEGISKKINSANESKQYEQALKLTDEFGRIWKEVEKVAKNLKNEVDELLKTHRKMYPLLKTITTEWLLYQNVLNHLITQMREEFRNNIQADLKWSLKEDFRLLIEKNTMNLRDGLISLQKQVSSMKKKENGSPSMDFLEKYDAVKKLMVEKDQEILTMKKNFSLQSAEFQAEADQMLLLWTNFKEQFEKNLAEVWEKYNDEQIVHSLLRLAMEQNNNFLSIKATANQLKMKEQELVEKVRNFILAGRINADLLSKSGQIEIHNDDWRKWLRLKQYVEIPLREIQMHSDRISNLVDRTIVNRSFAKNTDQFDSLCGLFQTKIDHIIEEYEQYIKDQKINLLNPLIKEEDFAFRNKLAQYQHQIMDIKTRATRADDFQKLLEGQLKELESFVHSEIYRLSNVLQNRNMNNYKKNLQWFDSQQKQIYSTLQQMDVSFGQKRMQIWGDAPDAATIITEVSKKYEEKKLLIMETLENALNSILEQLSSTELNNMKSEMEQIIQNKQAELNRLLSNMDKDLHMRINLKEFTVAAKELGSKIKFIENHLKMCEKELKKIEKSLENRSKIFGLKHHYLIEQWELFLLDFINSLHERQVMIEEDILENYLRFAARALKNNIVPFKMISNDIFMRRDHIQTRLVSLIGVGRLPGKINIELQFYYEGDPVLDQQMLASIDVMSATNVRFYLRLQRAINIAKVMAPILALIGSLFTLGIGLFNALDSAVLVPIPFIVVGAVFLLVWVKSGREKAVKSGIGLSKP